jgi:hypothetical protein
MSRAHRLSAARRAIERQKEKYSLFDALGIAVSEGYVDESPEARIERIDSGWEEWQRKNRISRFRDIRLALRSIKPEHRAEVKALWRGRGENEVPWYPEDYFLDTVTRWAPPEWFLFDPLDVVRERVEKSVEEHTKARLWE